MKIRITIDGKPITATLEDNATSRDFASLLPLTLTLEDYASTEKVSDLPRKLPADGAPAGVDPAVGDIAYYAPWGTLAGSDQAGNHRWRRRRAPEEAR